jgi:rhodanese-related sulfurtransferase
MQDVITFITQHMLLAYAFAATLLLLMIVEYLRLKRTNFRISTQDAVQLINHNHAVVIDIRPADQFRKGHVIDSMSLSTSDILGTPSKIEKYRIKPLIIVCNTGIEAQKLAPQLLKRGYNAYALAGGIRAWTEANMPLVKE